MERLAPGPPNGSRNCRWFRRPQRRSVQQNPPETTQHKLNTHPPCVSRFLTSLLLGLRLSCLVTRLNRLPPPPPSLSDPTETTRFFQSLPSPIPCTPPWCSPSVTKVASFEPKPTQDLGQPSLSLLPLLVLLLVALQRGLEWAGGYEAQSKCLILPDCECNGVKGEMERLLASCIKHLWVPNRIAKFRNEGDALGIQEKKWEAVFLLERGERPQIACQVGWGVYETCGIRGPECEKTKIGSCETCEFMKISRRNVLGWKSLPRFANFPRNSSSQPFPWSAPTPHRLESQDWSVRSSTPAIARGAPCPSSREETRGFRILGGPRIISSASPPRRGLGTQKRNEVTNKVRVWTWDQGHSLAICVLRLCE